MRVQIVARTVGRAEARLDLRDLIVANQQPRVEESALLGEGNRDDDEIPPNAPSTDAVRDAVRRILSPLVASDAASQFPRFYNSRRRTASTAAFVMS